MQRLGTEVNKTAAYKHRCELCIVLSSILWLVKETHFNLCCESLQMYACMWDR